MKLRSLKYEASPYQDTPYVSIMLSDDEGNYFTRQFNVTTEMGEKLLRMFHEEITKEVSAFYESLTGKEGAEKADNLPSQESYLSTEEKDD